MKSPVYTIFYKELLENFRDRKTVMNALIIGPLIGPLILALILSTVISRETKRAEKPLELPVIGAEHAPTLINFLRTQNVEIQPGPKDPIAAVKAQDHNVVMRLDAEFGKAFQAGDPAPVELIYDSSQRDGESDQQRITSILDRYGRTVGAMRLVARGVHPGLINPIATVDRDQASPEARGAMILGFLPYVLVLGAFMGGMYLAIDTTAGERERQSLEPLLANPVPRWQIMAGKLLATSAFAIGSLVVTLVAFAVIMPMLPLKQLGFKFNFGIVVFLQMLVALGPVVLLASAVQTSIAAYAKSFREAQSWLGLLNIIPAIPSMILMVVPTKPVLWMFAVPLLGQHHAVMKLVRNETITNMEWGVLMGSGLLLALIVSWIAARIYNRENLAISA
ncbi:MAG: ABC transporter permease [Ahniella sp.]|nr:ABC transporter permease [Ahniella sp.]